MKYKYSDWREKHMPPFVLQSIKNYITTKKLHFFCFVLYFFWSLFYDAKQILTPFSNATSLHVSIVIEQKDIFLDNIMVNRYGCPEDIGNLAVFFASDESEYVTGQIINVDGGMNSHVSTVAQMRALNKRTW